MQLPEGFIQYMKPLLGGEWSDFETAMHQAPTRGVRIHKWNTKIHATQQTDIPSFVLDALHAPVPWTPYGYYIDQESVLGRTVYHDAGAFYIQEPSAMAVAMAVDPRPEESILDLCAAPGGKTTAIASLCENRAKLVANEIHPTRVRILAENLERMGIAAAVTNNAPHELAKRFQAEFDAILVDAPCSGEGMFRKDPASTSLWNPDSPSFCAARQRDILASAVSMLRPGGRLIYSTCTFNPLENEEIVAWLVEEHGMLIDELPLWPGWSPGRPDWAHTSKDVENLAHTRRLWPHLASGEGHFVARLLKPGSETKEYPGRRSAARQEVPKEWIDWLDSHISHPARSWKSPIVHKDLIFTNELGALSTSGLRVLRPGTPLASMEKRRIVPLQGMALRLQPEDVIRRIEVDEETAARYMKGDALSQADDMSGYAVLHHAGINLGWVKAVPGRMNNLYPKGWRRSQFDLLSRHLPR